MKKFTKCLSLFLMLCIITTSSAFSVSSLTENATEQNVPEVSESTPKTETRKDEETSPDVLPILTLSSLSKEECMISKYVSEAEFNKSKHVKRLPAEETLDTYVFLNNDGTKSVYYMYENVKFIDDDGKTKEKDVSLVRKDNGYGIVRNNVDLYIPDAPRSGIDVSYDGYDVKITPVSSVLLSSSGRKENETVVYDGFFGAKTQLKYTPMLSGIKEDVVLEEYIPNASFDFILDTDGLFVYPNDEGSYLAPSASSKKIFDLGKVIVYDAVGRPTTGTMKIKTVTAGQRYQITVSAPEEFLTDPLTSYPVTIDPSVTVSDSVSGSGAIEDAVLFAGLPNHNGGDYVYLSLGYIDTTYTVGRVAVRLPGLYNSSLYNSVSANHIVSVYFNCWDTSGNQTHLINIHPITGPSWTESTATWSQSHTRDWSLDCGAYMPNAQWTAFNITPIVRGWKNGTYSAQLGFMMSNSEEPTGFLKKAPYSSEVGGSTYKPYVVMTYNKLPEPYGQNKSNWCWATAAKMVAEHNYGSSALNTGASYVTNSDGLMYNHCGISYDNRYTVDAGQRQIVMDAFNSDGNHYAQSYQIQNAMELVVSNNMTVRVVGDYGFISQLNINAMKTELSTGRWVVACLKPENLQNGHTIVIQSYNTTSDTYTCWDPYTNATMTFSSIDDIESPINNVESYYLSSFVECKPSA